MTYLKIDDPESLYEFAFRIVGLMHTKQLLVS